MEKEQYNVDETPDYNGHTHAQYVDPSGVESKAGRILEAEELYGNIETAEEYGYVARGYVQSLEPRIGLESLKLTMALL
jgi:amino acid transporter